MRKTRRIVRKRKQRGGDRRLLYLALFAWILAIANLVDAKKMRKRTVERETTDWEAIQWVSEDVYKSASEYFNTLKSYPNTITDINTPPVTFPPKEAIVSTASKLAELYEEGDTQIMKGVNTVAKISGETLVTTVEAASNILNWISDNVV
jgi:hypothetical protein